MDFYLVMRHALASTPTRDEACASPHTAEISKFTDGSDNRNSDAVQSASHCSLKLGLRSLALGTELGQAQPKSSPGGRRGALGQTQGTSSPGGRGGALGQTQGTSSPGGAGSVPPGGSATGGVSSAGATAGGGGSAGATATGGAGSSGLLSASGGVSGPIVGVQGA